MPYILQSIDCGLRPVYLSYDSCQRKKKMEHNHYYNTCEIQWYSTVRKAKARVLKCLLVRIGPRQANLVLIAYAGAAKVQASLRIRAVSPEPPLLAHTSIESRGTFRQKTRSLARLNCWACAVKICHDGMLEDTNSLDGAQLSNHRITLQNESLSLGPGVKPERYFTPIRSRMTLQLHAGK